MKIKIFTCLFLIFILFGHAQEISIKIEGGASGISYDSAMGNGTLGFGGGVGINYTYYFTKHWGVQTGIEARYNSNSFTLDNNQQFTSNEIDNESSAFQYIVNPDEYVEDQHFYSFNIPVMLHYQSSISNKTGFYFGFGGKVMFSTKQQVNASADKLALSGYYPDLNLEIDDLPEYGFGTVNNWSDDAEVPLSTALLVSLEGGLIFKLKEHVKLYTGIYVDYGLTNLKGNKDIQNLVDYSSGGIDNVPANGVLSTEKIIENSKYFSAGIQIKLGFKKSVKDKSQSKEKTVSIIEEPEDQKESTLVVVEEAKVEPSKEIMLSKEELTYIKQPLVFGTIDETQLPKELTERLNTIAQMINQKENVDLLITGFTCNLGSTSLNKKIGMERAKSVATYLENQGVSKHRINVASQGESNPLMPNTTIENRRKNRRVTIKVINAN